MSKSRVVLVSSPVAVDDQELECDRTAQLIDTIRSTSNARWVGWSSVPVECTQNTLSSGLSHGGAVSWLDLSAAEIAVIRDQVNKRMLWPIFHGRPDLMQFNADAFDLYLAANRRLARAMRPRLREDDLVWVHDYLHSPMASSLRDEGFAGTIGFLLHAPFPSPDRLTPLPSHKEFIQGLCCYDLLGFQTEACRARFHEAAEQFLGVRQRDNSSHDSLRGPFGKVETYVCEIPGNTRESARNAASPKVHRSVSYLRKCSDGRELIGSFATLDHSQGILERLKSFETLLDQAPHMCGLISMIQATPPRRQWLEEDDDVRAAVEQEFTRINGRFATLDWTPVQYFHKLLSPVRLTALYRSSRVGLITPMSEGVNLVAKDFVAAQSPADPGVLIASSLVGGSDRFAGALYVNPYDVTSIAVTLQRALKIPLPERQARWSSIMDVLEAQEIEAWCSDFIAGLMLSTSNRLGVAAA